AIIRLSKDRENLVFILWGAHAQRKAPLIDATRHLVLRAPHPSPLSAYRGFFGCRHFTRANEYLTAHNQTPIVW
ncbi:MAG: uracil-DNA glycosylase, partial [Muribaculaceae bacterium]|nr:uracil-DNA glycosylase [Muribaculaceae bacterium]